MLKKSVKPSLNNSHRQSSAAGRRFDPPAYEIDVVDRQNGSVEAPVQGVFEGSPEMVHGETYGEKSAVNPSDPRPNNTGLPDNLKTGIENLSGYSMDGVRVHYNSNKPTQLNALAYTQGRDIHVAAGQERHLPHEAWHVVQQAQGRVRPTMQMKDGVPVNDDQGLEKEADVMGGKALTQKIPDAFSALKEEFATQGEGVNLLPGVFKGDSQTVQRLTNEFTRREVDMLPTWLTELKAQYQRDDTGGELNKLWADDSRLKAINKYQERGRAWFSEALLNTTQSGKRPGNPLAVSIHGDIGNLEAALVADVDGTPYDGGHLVAWTFMGSEANVSENVVPQGKKLNNGPFALWEDRVLGQAIGHTKRVLEELGVENLPHTFLYNVLISYPPGKCDVSPFMLAKHGLIPAIHAEGFLPNPVRLTRRIPERWSAHAQPLALPSSNELGIKRRPNTPFLLGKTSDYGIVDKGPGLGDFAARGPTSLVGRLNYGQAGELSEGTLAKVSRMAGSMGRNPKVAGFDVLKLENTSVEEWLQTGVFTDLEAETTIFSDVVWKLRSLGIMKKDSQVNSATKSNLRIINSKWNGVEPHEFHNAMIVTNRTNGDELVASPQLQELGNFITGCVVLTGLVKNIYKEKGEMTPGDASTIDFSEAQRLAPRVAPLPDYAVLRFEATETQPQ